MRLLMKTSGIYKVVYEDIMDQKETHEETRNQEGTQEVTAFFKHHCSTPRCRFGLKNTMGDRVP